MSKLGGDTMSVKAKLWVTLRADETIVAETDDPVLWQKVLLAINQGGSENFSPSIQTLNRADPGSDPGSAGNAVDRFAQQLGLSRETVEGACAPSIAEPYLRLDIHCWEEMKSQTPERGPTAYSPMAIAATLLTLWFRAAALGNPTQAQAQAVLATIQVQDRNASRGIQRSDWLQARPGGAIVLNPALASRAVTIAKSFCGKNWKTGGNGK
jgi:hypothetical protein